MSTHPNSLGDVVDISESGFVGNSEVFRWEISLGCPSEDLLIIHYKSTQRAQTCTK